MSDGFEIAFAALPTAERDTLRQNAVARAFPRGAALFRQGDDPGAAYVIMEGRVKVTVAGPGGREVIVTIAPAGALLGDLAALSGRARSGTVTALEDTGTLALSATVLRAAVDESHALTRLLLDLAVDRLSAADAQRTEFAGFDVLGRVARRLVALVEPDGEPATDGVRIPVQLSQSELADWTAASREGVNRALNTLRGLGWIRTEGREVVVTDLEALREYGRG